MDAERPDFLTKYFLRRLAIARRNRGASRGAQHDNAVMEVILLVILLPVTGLVLSAVCLTLHWMSPSRLAERALPYAYVGGAVLSAVCFLVGAPLLGRRFKPYLRDPGPSLVFATKQDYRIAQRHKITVILTCCVVLPGVALVIAFWGRFAAHL